jgi:glycosyltransferase involved in cell wall biosynthesis
MKVSILIPYYGDRYYQLKRCLPFLMSQTHKNFEILVLYGGKRQESDRDPRDFLPRSKKVKFIALREGVVSSRSPNKAFRTGFEQSKGDYIIAGGPELLVPPNALKKMMEVGLERRCVPIQYHLTDIQAHSLFEKNIPAGWREDFNKIKELSNFQATETPWNSLNYHAPTIRNHFSFAGFSRSRFEEYLLPDVSEWDHIDSFIVEKEQFLGEGPIPADLEIYHLEHERLNPTIEETSVRVQRIRRSNLI